MGPTKLGPLDFAYTKKHPPASIFVPLPPLYFNFLNSFYFVLAFNLCTIS